MGPEPTTAGQKPSGSLAMRRRVRFTSFQLMTRGASLANPQLWVVQNLEPLLDEYRCMYDIRKVMARQDMERGIRLSDSLGRKNIPAACFAQGSAIGNIQIRRRAIRFLESHVSQEAQAAALEISGIRDAYRRLRYGFQPSYAVNWAYEDVGLVPPQELVGPHLKGWLEMVRDRRDWQSLQWMLEWSLPFFQNIIVLPFRRNARHVTGDIECALRAIMRDDIQGLTKALERLRAGLRWFFVLDHLEMQVITPLAILLVDLELLFKADRPRNGRSKFIPSSTMAPREFAQIRQQYSKFTGFVGLFRDGILDHPQRDEIVPIVSRANSAIESDDWPAFKELVLSITDRL